MANWQRKNPSVLYSFEGTSILDGDVVASGDHFTYTMPGGTMGANSLLRISYAQRIVGGTVNILASFGSLTPINDRSIAAGADFNGFIYIRNNNALNAQVLSSRLHTYNGNPTTDDGTHTQDTSADVDIKVSASGLAAGETIQLLYAVIELIN